MKRVEKGSTVFLNPFGSISVESQKVNTKKKKQFVLLVDGEDVYGMFVNKKVVPIRESDARFAILVPFTINAEGNEVPAQEGTVLEVWRPEYDLQ